MPLPRNLTDATIKIDEPKMKHPAHILSAAILCAAAVFISVRALALEPAPPKKAGEEQTASRGLPTEVVTTHTISLGGRKMNFTARAGAIDLRDVHSGALQAAVAFISYERADSNPETRPVAFVFNGGPGSSSAWLSLGALSPWRLRLADPLSPSDPALVMENAESWLAFADLVFIDPPGTGYSKIIGDSEELRKRFYSVQGDVDALAIVVWDWLTTHHRLASPKYLVGESYGGLRVVKLLQALREHESVGVAGLVLVSPVLDFKWLNGARDPLSFATLLPSYAAIARSPKDGAALVDAEDYASGEYVRDFLKGVNDAEAMSRLSENVARFSGLDREVTARFGGRVDAKTFARERLRSSKKVLSLYDGDIAGYDPSPFARDNEWADPALDSLRPVFSSAMVRITAEKLQWPIGDARYKIINDRVAQDWDYGRGGRLSVEAMSELRDALALDTRLKVVVAHGMADLVTPYFVTKLLLSQIPAFGDQARVQLLLLPGGHMTYLNDESRRTLRDAVRVQIEGK
jgi:carboxypeptidase C (cathepsin A)